MHLSAVLPWLNFAVGTILKLGYLQYAVDVYISSNTSILSSLCRDLEIKYHQIITASKGMDWVKFYIYFLSTRSQIIVLVREWDRQKILSGFVSKLKKLSQWFNSLVLKIHGEKNKIIRLVHKVMTQRNFPAHYVNELQFETFSHYIIIDFEMQSFSDI